MKEQKQHQSIEEIIRNRRKGRKLQVPKYHDEIGPKSDSEFALVRSGQDRYSPIDRGYLTDVQRSVNRQGLAVGRGVQDFSDNSSYDRCRLDSMDSEISARLGMSSISRRSSDAYANRKPEENVFGYQSMDERFSGTRIYDRHSVQYRGEKQFASEPECEKLYSKYSGIAASQRSCVTRELCLTETSSLQPAEMLSPIDKPLLSPKTVPEPQTFGNVRALSKRGALSPRKPVKSVSDIVSVEKDNPCEDYASDVSDNLMPPLSRAPEHAKMLSPTTSLSDAERLIQQNKRHSGYGRGILGCRPVSPALSSHSSESTGHGRGRGILSPDITPQKKIRPGIEMTNAQSKKVSEFKNITYYFKGIEDLTSLKSDTESDMLSHSGHRSSDVPACALDQIKKCDGQRLTSQDLGARPKTTQYQASASVRQTNTGNLSGNESTGRMSIISASMTGQIGFKKARLPKEASRGHTSSSAKGTSRK